MNKLEMQTLETRRMARMTTTERANHERIKREILGARKPMSLREGVARLLRVTRAAKAAAPKAAAFKLPRVIATNDPENPRRLNIEVTVQLAGTIYDESDGFGEVETPRLGQRRTSSLPDAEVVVDRVGEFSRGAIVRRRLIGDDAFAKLAYEGKIAPVKRPGDGTARDYVVAEGNILTGKDGPWYPGETLPDCTPRGRVTVLRLDGMIELAE